MLNNKELQKLQKLWKYKLKRSGFKDIENKHGDVMVSTFDRVRSGWNNGMSYETIKVKHDAAEEYYRLAGHFLHDHKFESSLDLRIWTFHSQGKSVREISRLLKISKIKYTKSPVHRVIERLKILMVERYRKENEQE